jgi:hypothetical protein
MDHLIADIHLPGDFRFYGIHLVSPMLSNQIGRNVVAIVVASVVALSGASAGQLDPRFDGKWAGVETFQVHNAYQEWQSGPPQFTTVIAIANSGRMLGVVSGKYIGRFEVSPKSGGNILIFGGAGIGRNECRLTLSADGKTLKEDGLAALSASSTLYLASHIPTNWKSLVWAQIYGTFHRVGK